MSVLRLYLINDLISEKDILSTWAEKKGMPMCMEMPSGCSTIAVGRSNSNSNVNYKITTSTGDHIISRIHSVITRDDYDGSFHIWDYSINGTFVNYKRLNGTVVLKDGDIITFGHPQGASITEGRRVLPYRWDLKYKVNDELALQCLHRLQDIDMNLDILTKTGVGILINNLRKKSTNAEITTLGKQLIKQWKKLVPESTPTSGGKRSPPGSGDDSLQSTPSESKRIRRPPSDDEDQNSNYAPLPSNPPEPESRGYFISKAHDTDDAVRLKAREMIKNALDSKPSPPGAFESGYLATEIESAIFNIFKDNGPKYKQRVRTRVMNLNDENNPDLRLNVFMGHVKPERLANMTSEEMASKDMKLLREKFIKETIDDHQMAMTTGTQSNLLTCGKCKQKNCTYNQVQTRSADEPMTTFVYCNNCGHRWKFC